MEAVFGPHRFARLADGLRERGLLELGNHHPVPEPSEGAAAVARRTVGRFARDRGEVLPGEDAFAQGADLRAGRGLLLLCRRPRAQREDVRGLDSHLHAPERRILLEIAGPFGAKIVLRRLGQAVGEQHLDRLRAARLRLAGEQEVVRKTLRDLRSRIAAEEAGARIEQLVHVAECGDGFAVDRHRRLGEPRFVDERRQRARAAVVGENEPCGNRARRREREEGEEEERAFHGRLEVRG